MYKTMTDEQFKYHCRLHGMKETDIIIADMIIRQEMTASQIAVATDYSVPAIKQKRLIIKARLGL